MADTAIIFETGLGGQDAECRALFGMGPEGVDPGDGWVGPAEVSGRAVGGCAL